MGDNIIKRKRESLGLSQSQFAKLSGVNFRTLQDYEHLFKRLEGAVSEGHLDTYQMLTIRNLSKTICEHMTARYSKVKKELMEVMGGRILDYEAKDILNQGINQGIQALITACRELNVSFETTAEKLKSKFQLNDNETQENMKRYWT